MYPHDGACPTSSHYHSKRYKGYPTVLVNTDKILGQVALQEKNRLGGDVLITRLWSKEADAFKHVVDCVAVMLVTRKLPARGAVWRARTA